MGGRNISAIHSFPIWLPQTQTWMYNQVRYLPEEIEPHIVCDTTQNLDQFRVPNIHNLSGSSSWRYYWDKGLQRLRFRRYSGFLVEQAKRYHVQVLHSHFGNVAWGNMGAIEQTGMKHVVTFYGYDVNCLPSQDRRWHERYHDLFEQADLVLCEGPHMMRCVRALGCPEYKVGVQPLGVQIDEIAFKPRNWNSTEPLCVLIAASFQEKKGIPYALEALGRIQSEVPLQITIIGDANSESKSQDEKEKILAVIGKYDLHSKVQMMGYQPHDILLKEAYKNHIFLSPSITASDGDTEGGAPVSIIEMAATGIPVVSTLHCDIPEVIRNGKTGLLAEERDVEKLISHLRWLVGNPSQWLQMLKAGRAHIEAKYDVRKQGRRLAESYMELVKSGSDG